MTDIVQAKRTLRRNVKAALAGMTPAQRAADSARICRCVLQLPQFDSASTVMVFAPMPEEVDPGELARAAIDRSMRLCVPTIDRDTNTLVAVWAPDWLGPSWRSAQLGIREPAVPHRVVPPETISVVIVPGIAFDSAGFRLGRGKGFYDRFLSFPGFTGSKIGVAFDCQVVDAVPAEPHDMRMDAVVSPTHTWFPSRR